MFLSTIKFNVAVMFLSTIQKHVADKFLNIMNVEVYKTCTRTVCEPHADMCQDSMETCLQHK